MFVLTWPGSYRFRTGVHRKRKQAFFFSSLGPVAQWIEHLRPKELVVRSTRTRVTISESESEFGSFLLPTGTSSRLLALKIR